MANMENELARLREQLASNQQKLESTQRGQEFTTARSKAAELALEKAIKEHIASKETITTELDLAKYQVLTRGYWFNSSDEVKKLREESKAQWQRAHEAELQIQRLEEELATSTLQQQLKSYLYGSLTTEHEMEHIYTPALGRSWSKPGGRSIRTNLRKLKDRTPTNILLKER